VLQNITVGAGLDLGYVVANDDNIANSSASHASLAGLALSVNQAISLSRRQHLFWSLTLGIPVSAPAYVEKESSVIYFSLDWKIW
jgi:hemolysin activation/secretion protein